MSANRDPLAGKRLDSWKEIAAFFGRAERTVKRWETERGLPVHRVPGGGRSAVFAYSDELSEWLKGRSQELDSDETASGEIEASGTQAVKNEGVRNDGVPRVSPQLRDVESTASRGRFVAWLVPLVLMAALIAYLSLGHSASRFKAIASRHTPNPEAQDLYLKGRYYWDRRTPDDLNRAIDYFTQAIVKDPSDAQAYVGLADCYNLLREFGAMPPTEAYPRALAAAQRAVELDDTSAEAHNSLAFVTFWWSWKGVTAEREFKRALELDPKFVRAHHWYATYLLALHRHPEALDQIEQARQLEPSSNAILADKGFLLFESGRHAEGEAQLKQLEANDPSLSSIHDYLGEINWRRKDYAAALAEWRRSAELRKDQSALALCDAREKGFASGGLKGLFESELPVQKDIVDHGSGSAYELATAYAALGQSEDALKYLHIAFDRREAALLVAKPISSLQDDAEYRGIRDEVAKLLAQ